MFKRIAVITALVVAVVIAVPLVASAVDGPGNHDPAVMQQHRAEHQAYMQSLTTEERAQMQAEHQANCPYGGQGWMSGDMTGTMPSRPMDGTGNQHQGPPGS